MPTIIGLFDLKSGADPEDYERWAQDHYAPVVRSLPSIDDWRAFRASGVFGGASEDAPPYRYFLIIEADLEGIGRDLSDERMQTLLAELHEFADPPTLVVTERFA